jgi:hypothetical protein
LTKKEAQIFLNALVEEISFLHAQNEKTSVSY